MKKKVAIIAAHPDDEVLGMGGTISKHTKNGDTVNILFLSDGDTGRDKKYIKKKRDKEIKLRKESAEKVGKLLKINSIEFEDYPNLRMDKYSVLEITQKIEKRLKKWKSQIIYTHHSSDTNIDHNICHKATIIACRPLPKSSIKSIRCFEILSSTEYSVSNFGTNFSPNLFVDVTKHKKKKIECLKAYDYELRPYPFPRSIKVVEAQLTIRGSQVGLEAAEAFMEVRSID